MCFHCARTSGEAKNANQAPIAFAIPSRLMIYRVLVTTGSSLAFVSHFFLIVSSHPREHFWRSSNDSGLESLIYREGFPLGSLKSANQAA
jgi:hypothetical protein